MYLRTIIFIVNTNMNSISIYLYNYTYSILEQIEFGVDVTLE